MKSFLILYVSLFFISTGLAQEGQTDTPQKEYHQIFLDKPIQKIKKVEYYEEGKGEIEFQLSEDKMAIYLLNYDGDGGVKAKVINEEGEKQEITRSKCHIHSLPEL